MAHQLVVPVALGSSQTGLELRARLADDTVPAVAVVEEGGGAYTVAVTLPDDYRGAVRFDGRLAGSADPWVFKAATAVNPEESEYADVRVSSRLAAADYVGPPAVVDIVAAIDANSADLNTALASLDVLLARLTAVRAAALDELVNLTDPLTRPLEPGYALGTLGELLGRLAAGPVVVVSPLDRQARLRVVAGDSYMAVDGRSIDVPRVPGDAWPADLTGWTLRFAAGTVEAGTVTAPAPAGAGQLVRVELASDVTAALRSGVAWAVEAVSPDGLRTVTLRRGTVEVAAAA